MIYKVNTFTIWNELGCQNFGVNKFRYGYGKGKNTDLAYSFRAMNWIDANHME